MAPLIFWTAVTHSVVVSPFMPHATHVMASFRTVLAMVLPHIERGHQPRGYEESHFGVQWGHIDSLRMPR